MDRHWLGMGLIVDHSILSPPPQDLSRLHIGSPGGWTGWVQELTDIESRHPTFLAN